MTESKTDLRGIFIPEVIFKLDIEMSKLQDKDKLLALIDDPSAEDWLTRWAHRNGHDVEKFEKVALGINVVITKGGFKI